MALRKPFNFRVNWYIVAYRPVARQRPTMESTVASGVFYVVRFEAL
jgi:hypothetical protein